MDLPQEFVIGLIASGITQVLRVLADKFDIHPSRLVINLFIFVGSVAYVFLQAQPDVPAISDPMAFAMELLQSALVIFGSAQLLYNALLQKIVYPSLGLDV